MGRTGAFRTRPWWSYNKTMKAINVTELKAHLSKYLRLASRGVRIAVKDRDEPIAELGPPQAAPSSWRDRLVRAGRLRPGTQQWNRLKISALDRRVDIQASLQAVREDSSEVRRR
jgi:antitoxin (DNA-binding transcriptional repressor) of toxin-antitoxin stability system